MCPTVVQWENDGAVGKGLGEGIEEELEGLGIQIRQFKEESSARRRLHGTIDIQPLEDMLDRSNGHHPTRDEAPTADVRRPKRLSSWLNTSTGRVFVGGITSWSRSPQVT